MIFCINRMLFLALKKVRIAKITPPQVITPFQWWGNIWIKITELITSDNIYITTTQRCYRQYYCIGRCERKPTEGKKNLIALHNNINHTTIKTYLAWMNGKKQQPHFNSTFDAIFKMTLSEDYTLKQWLIIQN